MSGLTLNISYIYVSYGTPSALLPPCLSRALPRLTLSDLSLAVQQGNTISQVKTGQQNKCILYCKSHISLRFSPRGEAAGKQSLWHSSQARSLLK